MDNDSHAADKAASGEAVASAFLQMLADAPASALEEELRRMEVEHVADAGHLKANYYAALRVRELLERRKRRERELLSQYHRS